MDGIELARGLLSVGWAFAGVEAPAIEPLPINRLPPPYRHLLDTRYGMTAELARRWGEPVGLRVLHRRLDADSRCLTRRVVLERSCDQIPIEVAVIRIELAPFDIETRMRLITGREPFGAVLASSGIAFRSDPLGFFRLRADLLLANDAGVNEGAVLYGRTARLIGDDDAPYGAVVEMLPRA